MSEQPTILYQDSGYPIERNLLDLPLTNYRVQKKIGLNRAINHLNYKINGVNQFLSNSHWELFHKKNAIWHFFNGISFGKTPWVVTFETALPRWQVSSHWLNLQGIKQLASDRCKKIIALSNCAKEIQIMEMQKNFPSYSESISKKITVIYPQQPQIIQSYNNKDISDNRIIFTLVGADFFRKGGKEILAVFDELLEKDAPIDLKIVSTLEYGDYASKSTKTDLKEAQAIIKRNSKAITHYHHLPNDDVINLFKKSHVGLMPSYGDTFGYSVLEAQACGCPVITTNIRALPEINNERCGWMIEIPKNRRGDGKLDTACKRATFSDKLYSQLLKIIKQIIEKPMAIEKKGNYALKRIEETHDPQSLACKLQNIYDKII